MTHSLGFPCSSLPTDPACAKLLGIYQQIQPGLFLQRVKILGGRLKPHQWHALAQIVRKFTPRTPLHLTTRQDVEVHDLRAEQIPALHAYLVASGLTGAGSAGDTLRNVTVCPCCGTSGRPDLKMLAHSIEDLLLSHPRVRALPRKFKIGLFCSDECSQAFIHDLGFVLRRRDAQWGLRVVMAGSLGARPASGVELLEWVEPANALPLAWAGIEVFDAHGDREHRNTARLRHVRQRLGDEVFAKLMLDAFASAKTSRQWPAALLRDSSEQLVQLAELRFPNGDIWPDQADQLGELAKSVQVIIGVHHDVLVFGPKQQIQLPDELASVAGGPSVVACPGRRWCSRGLVNTNAVADAIRTELKGELPPSMRIRISGCPNGCAHSAVADIGLTGARSTIDGQVTEVFNIQTGGGMGRDARLAVPLAQKVPPADVVHAVASAAAQLAAKA